jgi:phosphoribosylformylglycinamidine (FGAM) synthase PurS component
MDGFKISGKAFCVVEDLKEFAKQHKGKTVSEALKELRFKRIEEAQAKQFGMTVEDYRRFIHTGCN